MAYDFDPTGIDPLNVIESPTQEYHVIPQLTPGTNHRVIIPKFAPYILTGGLMPMTVSVVNGGVTTLLTMGADWTPVFKFDLASRTSEKPIYGGVSIINNTIIGTIALEYHTIGGNWTLTTQQISDLLNSISGDITRTYWESIANLPTQFPVVLHPHEETDLIGLSDVVIALEEINTSIQNRPGGVAPADHIALTAALSLQISNLIDYINDAIAAITIDGLDGSLIDFDGRITTNTDNITVLNNTINKVTYYGNSSSDTSLNLEFTDSITDELHITGPLKNIVIDIDSMPLMKIYTIRNVGSVIGGPVILSILGSDPGKLFSTRDQNTNNLVSDTTIGIDVINKPIEIFKVSPTSIFVMF